MFVTLIVSSYGVVFVIGDLGVSAVGSVDAESPVSSMIVIDLDDSIITTVDSMDDSGRTLLDRPDLAVLITEVTEDERMYLSVPSYSFTKKHVPLFRDETARVIISQSLPGTEIQSIPGEIKYWPANSSRSDGAAQTNIGEVSVIQANEDLSSYEYVAKPGFLGNLKSQGLYLVSPHDGGVLNTDVTADPVELIPGFICYCDSTDLQPLAQFMTEASVGNGDLRSYFPVSSPQAVPYTRGLSVADTGLQVLFYVGVLAAVFGLGPAISGRIWNQQEQAYRVDRLCGASEASLQVRFQMMFLCIYTIPALSGFLIVQAMFRGNYFPPQFTPGFVITVIAALGLFQVLATARPAVTIARICRFR